MRPVVVAQNRDGARHSEMARCGVARMRVNVGRRFATVPVGVYCADFDCITIKWNRPNSLCPRVKSTSINSRHGVL